MKPSTSSTTDSSPPTSDSSRPTSSNVTPDECQESKHHVVTETQPTTTFHPPQPSESTTRIMTTRPEVWSVDQVADWLRSVGLDNVAGQFVGKQE